MPFKEKDTIRSLSQDIRVSSRHRRLIAGMHTFTVLSGIFSLFTVGAIGTPTTLLARQSTGNKIALYLNGANFDIDYLQTLKLSYANTSAYVGRIKEQSYAEPLVVGKLNGDDNTISFLSVHESSTESRKMYIVPGDSKPVGFGLPHGQTPQGASTSGFSFGSNGELLHEGINRFYTCQNDALAPLHTYQIFWNAAGQPLGWFCQGPVKVQAGDA